MTQQPALQQERHYRIGFGASFKQLRSRIDDYNESMMEGWRDVSATLTEEYETMVRGKMRKVSLWSVEASERSCLDGVARQRGAATVKVVQGVSKVWRNANGQLQHKQRIKGGCILLAEELMKIYASFLNRRSALGIISGISGPDDLPPFRANNVQLAGKLRVSGRTIMNWRALLTRAKIILEESYSWHGSNSSYQIRLNPALIAAEPVKDQAKYNGFLYAVKNEVKKNQPQPQPAGQPAQATGVDGGGAENGKNDQITHIFRHTEPVLRTEIIQTITHPSEKVDKQPEGEKVGLPAQALSEKNSDNPGNQSPSVFLKGARTYAYEHHASSGTRPAAGAPEVGDGGAKISGRIKNMARQFCESDLMREIVREVYGGTWLSESQLAKLKKQVTALYDIPSVQDARKLSDLHRQYQQRVNILKRWLQHAGCSCGWHGSLNNQESSCPDCGKALKLRYIPLPSSGYWNPLAKNYFERGFGITKKWWKVNTERNVKAAAMSIVKKEVNKVIKTPTVEQYCASEQRIGKLNQPWAMEEFLIRVRDRKLLQA